MKLIIVANSNIDVPRLNITVFSDGWRVSVSPMLGLPGCNRSQLFAYTAEVSLALLG